MRLLQNLHCRLGLLILIACLHSNFARAQSADPKINIELLGPEHGLPDRAVRCLAQDDLGFIWVSIGASLWRYDGYSFTNFSHLLGANKAVITLIDDLVLGPNKQLWVGHSNGLTIVNPSTLKSSHHDLSQIYQGKISSRQVIRIHFDQDGAAWISMLGNKLVKVDSNVKPLLFLQAPTIKGIDEPSKLVVSKVFTDQAGRLYLYSSANELSVFNQQGKYIESIQLLDESLPKGLQTKFVYSSDGDISVQYTSTSNKHGLVRKYLFSKRSFTKDDCSSSYYGTPFPDRRGYVWYLGDKEIGVLNARTKKFIELTNTLQQKAGAETYFFTAFVSSDNSLWVCSSNGLFKITLSEEVFHTYLNTTLQKPSDVGTSVRGITEDSSGNIWLCSYGYKKDNKSYVAHKLNPKTGFITHQQLSITSDTTKVHQITSAFIMYKFFFVKSGMYAITDGTSLLKLTAKDAVLKGKAYANVSINEFTSLYELNDSILWLGSLSGLIQFNTKSGTSVLFNNLSGNYIKNIRVNFFMPWSSKTILVSTSNGLYVLDRKAQIVEHYGVNKEDKIHLPVQSVLYTVGHRSKVWAATPSGLLCIDTASKQTRIFTTKDGLPDNNVYACLPDDQDNLWLTTNKGLCRFSIPNFKLHNYTLSDGLPHMEFNTASFLKASDGKLYFGGLNGIIAFDPSRLNQSSEKEVPLQLVSYSKYSAASNQIETVNNSNANDKIVFLAGDRFFSFSFMAPDYRHTDQNRFRYKLQGWADNEWHLFETGNKLSFNSLPAGTYRLDVQVSVGGADWSQRIWSTTLKVESPWYETAWFYILSLGAVALVFYALYRYRLNQIMRIHQIRNRISADMHDEIGSTLSSISFYSQALLMQPQNSKQKEVLERIKDNAQQVQEGLSDIIWSVKASLDDVENVFSRMMRFGAELLEPKNIQFHFERDESLLHQKLGMTERKNFYLIFKEAVNNAAKHAHCENIWVQIQRVQQKIQMTIEDDGQGFISEEVKKGNGLSNMQERAVQMKGSLLVQPTKQGGTVITLIF